MKKDYIVVKDWDIAEDLMKKPPPSLRGKTIIVAPNGLKEVALEDLVNIPAVKTFIHQREKELLVEVDIILWKAKGYDKDSRALISKIRQSLVEVKKELSNE